VIRDNEDTLPAGLSQPALRALASAGVTSLNDFTRIQEADLKRMHGIGPHAMKKIKEKMDLLTLAFLGEE